MASQWQASGGSAAQGAANDTFPEVAYFEVRIMRCDIFATSNGTFLAVTNCLIYNLFVCDIIFST